MWVGGNNGALLFEDGYRNDLSVFDSDSLKGIRRVKIGNDCMKNVTRFGIDGLNELKTLIVGERSFELNETNKNGSECVIMNCVFSLKGNRSGDMNALN